MISCLVGNIQVQMTVTIPVIGHDILRIIAVSDSGTAGLSHKASIDYMYSCR